MKRNALFSLAGCLVLLATLLSACSLGGATSTSTSAASTKTATSTLSSTKTVASSSTPTSSCNVTYGCGVGSSNLTPHHGNGYTINYPGSWVIKSDGDNGDIFSSPDNSASLHVFVQGITTATNPLRYEFGTLSADNCKPVAGGVQSLQFNGVAWQQSQFVCLPGDAGQAGGKTEQIAVLVSTALHNNSVYSMDYMATPNNFNNVSQTFFKPMAASFKFQ